MARLVHTLLLIDSFSIDRELYRRYLLSDSTYAYRVLEAESVDIGLEFCRNQTIDAILLNEQLPDGNGLQFLKALQNQNRRPAVVIVTNEGSEANAVQAIKSGAEDYLVKRNLTPESLQGTMRSAIENTRLRLRLQESEARYRAIVEDQTELICRYFPDCTLTFVNQAYCRYFQSTPEQLLGKSFLDLIPESHRALVQQRIDRLSKATPENAVFTHEHPVLKPDGEIGWQQWTDRAIFDEHQQLIELQAVGRDISDRVHCETDLRDSEAKWRSFVKDLPAGVAMFDRNMRYVSTSDRWLSMYGLDGQNLIGRSHYDVFPNLPEAWKAVHQRCLAGATEQCELDRFPQANGTVESIRWEVHPWRTDTDEIGGILIFSEVITERQQAEQRLKDSEERLQLGIQVAGVALARFDYASDTVTLSPEAAKLFGIEQLTSSRDRIHATFHPDDRAELAELIQQALDPASQGWFTREHRVVWQTGEIRWLNVRKQIFFDRSGSTPRADYAILAAIDITEQKRANDILRQSEDRYRSLSSLIPQLVWIADANGFMLDVNERWSVFTGLSLEQAQTEGWQQIVHPDDVAVLGEAWQSAQQAGISYQAEGRIRGADGIYRWHLHQAMPLYNEQQQLIKWFGTATDIHDLKQIEAERAKLLIEAQAARAEAEAANRSKDEFVAVVAHELRSPLNSIAGWAKLLQTRKFDEATIAKGLETIWRNTQTQVQLVEDLLDISRMVRGTLQINIAPVNLRTVIEAAFELVLPLAEAKQILLVAHLNEIPNISGDFYRLQQIVVNLLTNAVKFTPAQGRIDVQLEQVATQVRLTVRDTGKGIAPEFLPEIFERFKQGQKNAGAKDGLGLGLAIVKNLVELHHGTIATESAGIGQGATFTVCFPSTSQAVPSIQQIESTSLAGIRILVVDDESDMLNLIRFMLQDVGAEVQTAANVRTGLELFQQFKPDIVLSDIAMPEQNGYEFIQQLRALPEGQIPAIALTAYSSTTAEERSLQAGFQRHLSKPVASEVLIAAISNLVQR